MEKKVIYTPIKIFLYFLIITELLIWIGPIDYHINNDLLLLSYLALVNIALYRGYKLGVAKHKSSKYYLSTNVIDTIIILGLFFSIYDLFEMWSQRGLSVSLTTLLNSLIDPGTAYYSDRTSNETNYILLLFSPFKIASVSFGIVKWRDIPFKMKLCVATIIFIEIISWIGIGVRKGVLDTLLIIIILIVSRNTKMITNKRLILKIRIFAIIVFASFCLYFVFSNLSRYGVNTFSEIGSLNFKNVEIRDYYLKHWPIYLTIAFMMICSYLTQGYYALSKGLELGILPISFLGSSWFTISIAKKFSYDPTETTYMYMLQSEGIDMSINWHSIYLWLANDFTFIGVPIIIFLIGYFFAQSWMDAIKGSNILSYPVLALFSTMIFYFFANNQVLSFSFIPFVFWFSAYQISRKSHK